MLGVSVHLLMARWLGIWVLLGPTSSTSLETNKLARPWRWIRWIHPSACRCFLSKEPEGDLPLTQPLLRTEKETEFLGFCGGVWVGFDSTSQVLDGGLLGDSSYGWVTLMKWRGNEKSGWWECIGGCIWDCGKNIGFPHLSPLNEDRR